MLLLELKNINTHYGLIHILQDVCIEVPEGEIVCLLGGNACGKSTTLKTILGIVKPTSGDVIFCGERVNDRPTSYRVARGMSNDYGDNTLRGGAAVYDATGREFCR